MNRVLLVEDNPDDLMHIADMIRDAGGEIDVHAVTTGDEAMAYFKEHNPNCSIVDYRLETEDGLTIMKAMKRLRPFHPVVMMTGQGNEELAATSIKEGAADYLIKQRLTKPFLKTIIENSISRSALEEKVAEQETARKQFLKVLVHDLRSPLNNIRQLGDLAVQDVSSGELGELTSLLGTQSSLARRASDLVTTLEAYALLDGDVAFSPVSLNNVVEEVKENLGFYIDERQAKITIGQLPMAFGHHVQLTQLFQNLIQNGLKYNAHSQPAVTIELEDSSTVVVSDNGIGIPDKHTEAVFEPLKRLWSKDKYEGTGIGLAICKKIVDQHLGEIWCTSNEREGSKFHIRLPAAR